MTPFPRPDYASLERYDPGRVPVEIDLSDNTNLWGPHPDALRRVRAVSADDLARYPSLYADPLRDAVAERFGVPSGCVTTGAGSDDVLDSVVRACSAPGGRLAYAAPTFSMAESFGLMNGMEPVGTPWPEAEGDVTSLLRSDPDVIYLCRPNNPTGHLAGRPWMDALLEARGPDGPLVIVDEAYADFAGETLLPDAPTLSKVVVARTASKAYGLAGMRVGYAVASPDVTIEVDKARGPYKVARLASEAAAAALRDESGWMAEIVQLTVRNRTRLAAELASRGYATEASWANFLLVTMPAPSAQEVVAALRRVGVGVRPFSDIPGLGEAVRVTVGPWPLMERFLTAIDHIFGEAGS